MYAASTKVIEAHRFSICFTLGCSGLNVALYFCQNSIGGSSISHALKKRVCHGQLNNALFWVVTKLLSQYCCSTIGQEKILRRLEKCCFNAARKQRFQRLFVVTARINFVWQFSPLPVS